MTDAEARLLVAHTVRGETLTLATDMFGDTDHASHLADALTLLANRIIDAYLSHLFAEPHKEMPS